MRWKGDHFHFPKEEKEAHTEKKGGGGDLILLLFFSGGHQRIRLFLILGEEEQTGFLPPPDVAADSLTWKMDGKGFRVRVEDRHGLDQTVF